MRRFRQTEVVTQLETQTKNPLETGVDAADTRGGVGIQQKDEAIFEAALAEAEGILQSQRRAREVSPHVRAWHALVALYDWVTGPPATRQEPISAEIQKFEYERQAGVVRPL